MRSILQASAWPSPSHRQSCRSWPQVRKRFWKGCVHSPQSSSVWPCSRAYAAVTFARPNSSSRLLPKPLAPQPGSQGRIPGPDLPSAMHSSWFPPAAQSPAPQQWPAQPQSVQESRVVAESQGPTGPSPSPSLPQPSPALTSVSWRATNPGPHCTSRRSRPPPLSTVPSRRRHRAKMEPS